MTSTIIWCVHSVNHFLTVVSRIHNKVLLVVYIMALIIVCHLAGLRFHNIKQNGIWNNVKQILLLAHALNSCQENQ